MGVRDVEAEVDRPVVKWAGPLPADEGEWAALRVCDRVNPGVFAPPPVRALGAPRTI